jgi:membrane protein DedA with SNARE-associated domain
VTNYGTWVYALLFLIIFVETGVVVMPFLPGDSLLFVVGAMCGVGLMDYPLSVALLWAAAVLGNQSNYTIGRILGPKVFQWEQSRFFNRAPSTRRMRSTRSTAASPSSRRASCPSCAPSPRSWPAWRR